VKGVFMALSIFRKSIRKLIREWEKKFCAEAKESNYETLQIYQGDEQTKKEFLKWAEECLTTQIEYIEEMVSYLIWHGMAPVPQNYARVKKFLNMQLKQHPWQHKPKYQVTFEGSRSFQMPFAYVQRLGEIDFADSYDFLMFEIIQIDWLERKNWTKRKISDIIEEIKDDFSFDGYDADIKIDGVGGSPIGKERSLCLMCKIG
jgi:hypothetical protein